MKRSARFLFSLLAGLCLLNPLNAMAGEVGVEPLEGSDYNCYWYYFPGADVSLALPLDAQLQVLMDNAYQKALGIGMADIPDTYFAFFALKHEELEGMSLGDMEEDGIKNVLDMISSNGASLAYEALDDLLPGQRALRVKEPAEGTYSEHLLALKDGWVLNMMAARPDGGTSLSREAVSKQESMLRDAVAPEGIIRHYQSYTLPDSTITLSAPGSMYITLTTESPDFLQLSLCPKKPGAQFSVLQLYALRDAAYEGQSVTTLSQGKKEEALKLPAVAAYDASSLVVLEGFGGGFPALSYTSDGSFSHLLALKDGWALYASILPFAKFIDPDWVDALQEAALRQLLDGETALPDWLPAVPVSYEGDLLRFPLTTRIMDIRIPQGYGVDIARDTADSRDVFLYALDGSSKYFHIASISAPMLTGDATLSQMYTEAELLELCGSVSETIGGMGLTASSAITGEGPAGVPAVYTTTEEQIYEQYFWAMDSQSISFSFTSEDSPVTKDESALLLSLAIQGT